MKKLYREVWQTILTVRSYSLGMAAIFAVSALVATQSIGFLKPYLDEVIRQFVEQTADLKPIQLFCFILNNNAQSALFGILLGVMVGLFPFLIACFNGVLVGYVISSLHEKAHEDLTLLWKLIPHGIFELPAVFIALGLGVWCGLSWFQLAKWGTLKYRLAESLKTYVLCIFPLLTLAAVIETVLMRVWE